MPRESAPWCLRYLAYEGRTLGLPVGLQNKGTSFKRSRHAPPRIGCRLGQPLKFSASLGARADV